MARHAHRAFQVLTNLAIGVVLLVSLGMLVPGLMGMQRYVITTGSMTGTYDVGTLVFDRAVPARDLRVGDVITYLPPASSGVDHLVTHRLAAIRTHAGHTTYRTKGDANPARDPWTFELSTDRQPRVAFAVPYVGQVFIALADPATRRLVIGLPAVVIGLLALRELMSALRKGGDSDTDGPAGQEA